MQTRKQPTLPVTGFFLILVLSILYSFLLPICQVPDEETHVKAICEAIGLEGYYEQYLEIETPYITSLIFNREQVDLETYRKLYAVPLDYSQIHFSGSFKISIFKYLPQIFGVLLALLLHVPLMASLHMTEVSAAVISAAICYAALRSMPVKREVFLAVMLLPVSLQQYGSFNYDATLLPLSFLAVAWSLDMVYRGQSAKKWIRLTVCAGFIAVTKPPYAGLFLLLITLFFCNLKKDGKIDREMLRSRFFWLAVLLVNAGLLTVAALYLLRNAGRISILAAVLMNPSHYSNLFKYSWKMQWWDYLSQTVGNLGWLDTPMPVWFIWFVLAGLLVMSLYQSKKIPFSVRACSAAVLFAVVHLIFISMISHTFMLSGLAYDSLDASRESLTFIGIILGVQGRYFVPVFMNLFLLIGANVIQNRKFIVWFQVGYYAVSLTVPVVVLLQRYWI